MAIYNLNMFYLGNFLDMDVYEGDLTTEYASDLLGSYTKPPLVSVTSYDSNSDGLINDNEVGNEYGNYLSYDAGSGSTSQYIDSTTVYNARIHLGDGSSVDIIVTAVQTLNGDVFITDYKNYGSFDNLNVHSFDLLSVYGTHYTSFFSDSSVDGTQTVCFVAGTSIDTPAGPRSVEDLRPGDLVFTQDRGTQPVRWLHGFRQDPNGPDSDPILFDPDALGDGAPTHTLRVSPQHRLLLRSPVARRMFGTAEILVAAKDLLCLPGVTQPKPKAPVAYWHLAFSKHELIVAEGTLVESFYPGEMALRSLSETARAGLHAIYPELAIGQRPAFARPVPPGRLRRKLIARISRNGHSIVTPWFGQEANTAQLKPPVAQPKQNDHRAKRGAFQ